MANTIYLNLKAGIIVLLLHTLYNYGFCDQSTDSGSDRCKKDINGYCLSGEMNKAGCTLTPQSSEGPFFLPNQPVRKDVREGRPGIPFDIQFSVKDVKTCKPVKDATVHLWHSDAMGFYSAYAGYYPLGDPGSKKITGGHSEPTEKATFLRGIQMTDDTGTAGFKTIYPGWYKGRPLHIHFKITIGDESKYTGELYFPDEFTDEVAKVEPYNQHPGKRLQNKEDWQFIKDNGEALVMIPTGNFEEGLVGHKEIVIDLSSNH